MSDASADTEGPSRLRVFTGVLILVLITSLAYLPAIRGGYVWDDDAYVTENANLRSLDGLHRIWLDPTTSPQYYPLVFTTFWLEYRLWGLEPHGYHITNVALHIANAMLLWIVLRHLAVPGAFLAAAIFALHPVHVESVAWISERKNVLAGLFAFCATLAWLRWTETRRWTSYALAVGLFACAMLSKTVICTLPLILALLTWWRDPRRWRGQLPYLAPFLLIATLLAGMTLWTEYQVRPIDIERRELSLLESGLVAGRSLWFYAGKLVWPSNLMTIYPLWEIDAQAAWQYTFPVAALAILTGLWFTQVRFGAGPLVAVLCFAIALGPVLGFLPFEFMRLSYVADHLQYPLASSSLIAFGAALVSTTAGRLCQSFQRAAMIFAGFLLLLLGALSWQHALDYKDAETLWRANLAKNHHAPKAHFSLGKQLAEQNELDEAIEHFLTAVELEPDYADAHTSLGLALLKQRKMDEAISHLTATVILRPYSSDAQMNLGTVLDQQGKKNEAIRHYIQALRLDPGNAAAHINWGLALYDQGNFADAISHFKAALRIAPGHPAALANLQRALSYQAPRPYSR